MQFKPIGSRAIVRLLPDDPPKKGSIIFPDSSHAKSPFQRALVLAVGDGAPREAFTREPCSFKVGDTVVIPRNQRPPIDGFEADMALVPISEVVLVIETEP